MYDVGRRVADGRVHVGLDQFLGAHGVFAGLFLRVADHIQGELPLGGIAVADLRPGPRTAWIAASLARLAMTAYSFR